MTTPLVVRNSAATARGPRRSLNDNPSASRRVEPGDRARFARQLEDVQTRRRTIERVDVAAVVDVDVVRLDRLLHSRLAVDLDARLGRVGRDLGDEARDFDFGTNGLRMSTTRTPALKYASTTSVLSNFGLYASLNECGPKRPPR